ncbi:MAG: MFS transporter [Xanthobacteraceae bacterium]|uniref:MFS transporter n=1 Tax=Pseudolabrys sp. TaxID=1960880 RepID=UPI003D0B6790
MTLPDASSASLAADGPDSATAWRRLVVATLIGTIGGVGMWSVPVTLPAVQAEFAIDRAAASLPYTLCMLGFAAGGVLLGKLTDRIGVMVPVIGSAILMGLGYVLASQAHSLWIFALGQGVVAGLGTAVFFGPLMADISHWFDRRRGIAVAIAASGNYIAGAIWPVAIQHGIDRFGWRVTILVVAAVCVAAIVPLALLLRRPPPRHDAPSATGFVRRAPPDLGMSPGALQLILGIAGVACCVAMAMPQVHIVAYCGDLGYGVARGAEMLSLMLGFGIISRVASGFIADRIGGVRTLLLSSALQGVALVLYFLFDGLTSLYVISILFGLFQGGIVPSYAIIVREYFAPQEAGSRIGFVIMATILGMALGGWMSGVIFDMTGSYRIAFANGIAWNLLNLSIATWLLMRSRGARPRLAAA